MHLTILLLVFSMLFLVFAVLKKAEENDRDAPTDPNWYDIKHFREAADIIDDEDMRSMLDACLEDGKLDSGMTMRAWAMIGYLQDAPNSLHNPVARSTSLKLATSLENLLERLETGADRESINIVVARADEAYLAYRSYFYDLIGE